MSADAAPGGYRLALSAYLIWGLAPLFWKLLDVPAMQLTAHRFWQVLVIGAVILWVRDRRSIRSLVADRRLTLVHLGAGALLAVNWLVYVYSIATDRVVDSSLGYFINPLLSVAIGVAIGERLTPLRWLAVGSAAVGVVIITIDAGSLPWISLVLASTFAVYGLIKKMSPRDSLGGLTTEMLLIAPLAVGYLAWLAWTGDVETGGSVSKIALLGLGAITTAPLVLFGAAAKRIPLWTVGLLQFLAPSLQFLLGVFVFGEALGRNRLVGFVVIWFGLALFGYDTLKRRERLDSVVVVEATAGLAAEQPGLDHSGQQGRGSVQLLPELVVQRIGHRHRGVETDQVGQGQRAHRMGAAGDHSLVDVLLGGEPGFEHADRRQDVGDQQGVDDEAGPVLGMNDPLAQLIGSKALGPFAGLVRRVERRDQLHQVEHRHRVEEVDADHMLRSTGRHRQFHDRDR